ncbi:hypothetical protein HI914_02762 [Erysiphe necator]|uniref:Putative tetraspanin n=1 Tax=Uncinula necator TaxID=52586 RepID=A0A0B1PDV0_UNCNE|nr:hypothetical protein HI914_02762 [Erysiphe necator]KHJ35535.1 putative tetraspanin [Erysiphe necator]
MKDSVLLAYVVFDLLFAITGIILLITALSMQSQLSQTPNLENVAKNLILDSCPLKAAIANGILVLAIFVMSIPSIAMPRARGLLKLTGYFVFVSAVFTMVLGLTIWFETLKTRKNLLAIWKMQDVSVQSLLQTKYQCCGYTNSTSPPFVVDNTCPNPTIAAARLGCVFPFSAFANNFLDVIFTAIFGMVGVDALFILATAILLKDRKEQARYRQIFEKNGGRNF